MLGTCKFCGEQATLVKAHIIPRSFYPERARGKKPLLVLSPYSGEPKRRAPKGIYDENLVCKECEARFDPYDDYAAKRLLDRAEDFRTITHNGEPVMFTVDSFDYTKLKLFGLCVLWRAAASSRPEFQNVSLGSFLQPLRDMIDASDPGAADTFSEILIRFSDVEDWQSGFMSPFSEKIEDVNFYRFIMGAHVLYIKVDEQPLPEALSELAISPGSESRVIARKFEGGPEYRAFKRLVNKPIKE